MVRFERSTLPNHKGTRTVVLRYLKIITPVKCVIPFYDGHIVRPEEEELYQRDLTTKQAAVNVPNRQVWSFDIDTDGLIKQGLQLLWDA